MKPILVISLLILFIPGFAQQDPVDVSCLLKKVDDHQYRLQLDFSLQKAWHVYAVNDTSLSIDALTITASNDAVQLADEPGQQNQVSTIQDPVFDIKKVKVYQSAFRLNKILFINGTIPPVISLSIKGFASNNKEFIPIDITKQVPLTSEPVPSTLKVTTINIESPLSDCGDSGSASSKGLLAIFILGFGGGFLALFTPCVFPMIPVTVSYFNIRLQNRNRAIRQGLWYGASILLIYLLASLPFHLLGNFDPQLFNTISTNAWVNLFFFIVFIVFALSLFGWFEITLPSSISNFAGSKSRLGSAAGIFFMALTLAIVSFSCTGPVLGSLLVGSLSSATGAWALTAGMAGFGCALGLPFALFAIFPQWLQRLPKSGSWMNTVKKSLAFIELALAIKFLSNADLVEHWGILKREVFIVLWFLIFLALALYLLGVFEKPKQSSSSPFMSVVRPNVNRKRRIAPTRFVFGVFALLFCFYLTPALTQTSYANLQLLSGFAPPLSYSIYGKENLHGKGLEADVVNDYTKAVQLSKQQHKPILIDFTGWACVNCRKMEENVWTNSEVKNFIKDKFILVSLYVDDRKKLSADQQIFLKTEDGQQKQLITVGDKYAAFQAENFRQVTQPLYVILGSDEKLMNHPVGYTPDAQKYKHWLECGYNAFAGSKHSEK